MLVTPTGEEFRLTPGSRLFIPPENHASTHQSGRDSRLLSRDFLSARRHMPSHTNTSHRKGRPERIKYGRRFQRADFRNTLFAEPGHSVRRTGYPFRE